MLVQMVTSAALQALALELIELLVIGVDGILMGSIMITALSGVAYGSR